MRLQSALAAAGLLLATALPPTTTLGASAKKPAAKASSKTSAKSSKATHSASKGSAKAAAKAAPGKPLKDNGLSEAQLAAATQVLTGRAECEFNENVLVQPHPTLVGTFRVKFHSTTYTMVPEETTTGAVRLFDKKAGVVWLQIPVKSMLMDNRAGVRLIDACAQPAQRMALAESVAKAAAAAAVAEAASAAAAAAASAPMASASASAPSAEAAASAASSPALNFVPAAAPEPPPLPGQAASAASAATAASAASAPSETASAPAAAASAPVRKWFWQR